MSVKTINETEAQLKIVLVPQILHVIALDYELSFSHLLFHVMLLLGAHKYVPI